MKHKTLDEIIKTLHEVEQELTGMIDEDMTLTEAWIPIEDFDSDYEGMCWVLFNGAVRGVVRRGIKHGIYETAYHYLLVRGSGILPAEHITDIIPLHKPEPPNGK
ncbi:MAG: hypothetical protein GY941_10780 [Planctomycetes bacterium]|nr:hypothetical protein [Planctomycetota bacterium]